MVTRLTMGVPNPKRNPDEFNHANPTLMPTKYYAHFNTLFPRLRNEWFDWPLGQVGKSGFL